MSFPEAGGGPDLVGGLQVATAAPEDSSGTLAARPHPVSAAEPPPPPSGRPGEEAREPGLLSASVLHCSFRALTSAEIRAPFHEHLTSNTKEKGIVKNYTPKATSYFCSAF